MVKVSVIVPIYNAERCISETLYSILNSSLHDIEVICVNDCSTDNSLKVLQEFSLKDHRILIINNMKIYIKKQKKAILMLQLEK